MAASGYPVLRPYPVTPYSPQCTLRHARCNTHRTGKLEHFILPNHIHPQPSKRIAYLPLSPVIVSPTIGSPHLPLSPRGSILRSPLALPSFVPCFSVSFLCNSTPLHRFSLSFHPHFCVCVSCRHYWASIPRHHPLSSCNPLLFNSSINPQPLSSSSGFFSTTFNWGDPDK